MSPDRHEILVIGAGPAGLFDTDRDLTLVRLRWGVTEQVHTERSAENGSENATQAGGDNPAGIQTRPTKRRVRPGDSDWQSPDEWKRLKEAVGVRLINVESPLVACAGDPDTPACQEMLRNLRNPFFNGDQPWATQSSGWLDAWMSPPSAYAVAAESATDVADSGECKSWEKFEERVEYIYSVLLNLKGEEVSVSRDVKLIGRDGLIHQFDVYYAFTRAGVSPLFRWHSSRRGG